MPLKRTYAIMIHTNILAGKLARKGLVRRLVADGRIIFKRVLNI